MIIPVYFVTINRTQTHISKLDLEKDEKKKQIFAFCIFNSYLCAIFKRSFKLQP